MTRPRTAARRIRCLALVALAALLVAPAEPRTAEPPPLALGEPLDWKALRRTQPMKRFSQFGQDVWVTLAVFPGVRDGYFVDVGSGSGVMFSNSKHVEDLGWRGICIDPFPRNMRTRTCRVFPDVVSDEAGQKVEFRVAGDLGGIDEHIDRWREAVEGKRLIELETTTLDAILAEAKAPSYIHYMSIDIEGAELLALQGLSLEKYTVGAFTIEHNHEEPRRSQIREHLEKRGYWFAHSVHSDDYFVHPSALPGSRYATPLAK